MARANVLIIDDEEKIRLLLSRIIKLEGFAVWDAENLKAGMHMLEKQAIDILLCDGRLPDGNGVDFVETVKKKFPQLQVIILTAYGNIADGVRAMKNGAFDYITKGDDNEKIIPLLNKAESNIELRRRVLQLQHQVGLQYDFDSILGNSPLIKTAIDMARKVAATDTTVLLLGETGTGKEVFAQAIHLASRRSAKAFVALNCSAFSRELLESELFGHKAGSFTGATRDKKGLVEEAQGGTIFLDEIGEMPVDLQAKLLRLLETRQFIKLGETQTREVDIRIIAATNRNLESEIQKGHFREDLFYRLNVFSILLPALRDRRKDIPLLANYFLKISSAKVTKRIDSISTEAMNALQGAEWKGNIRELKNAIERAVILANDSEIMLSDFPTDLQAPYSNGDNASSFDMATIEKLHIERVLRFTKGNKAEAARLLNIGQATLYRKIEEYGIPS